MAGILHHLTSRIDGHELKRLLLLTTPLYIANLTHMGMGVVDTIVAGQAGPDQLAAVALGVSVCAPVMIALGMVLTIVGPMISRYRGAGCESKVGLLLNNARLVAGILMVVELLALWGGSMVFPYVTDDAVLVERATQYVYFMMWGVPASILLRAAAAHFEGYGQTRPGMLIGLFGLLLNIPLNFILVFGWGVIPALGGAGCGLATALVHTMMCAMAFGMLLFSRRHQRMARQMWMWRSPEWGTVKSIFRLGFPLGVASLCEMTFFSSVLLIIAPLGELMVSAQQVAINVSGVIFMLPLSLGIAASIRAAYHVGARNKKAFDGMLHALFFLAAVLVCLFMVLTILFRRDIISLYTDNEAVINTAQMLLVFCAIYQIPDALQVMMSGLLRGCHDTDIITWVNISCYWLIGFPLSCILIRTDWIVPAMGPSGAWMSFIVALTLAAICFTARFIRTRKRILGA